MNEFINFINNNISAGKLDKLELFLSLNKFLTTHWSAQTPWATWIQYQNGSIKMVLKCSCLNEYSNLSAYENAESNARSQNLNCLKGIMYLWLCQT